MVRTCIVCVALRYVGAGSATGKELFFSSRPTSLYNQSLLRTTTSLFGSITRTHAHTHKRTLISNHTIAVFFFKGSTPSRDSGSLSLTMALRTFSSIRLPFKPTGSVPLPMVKLWNSWWNRIRMVVKRQLV